MKIAVQGPGKPGSGWQHLEYSLASAFIKGAQKQGHEACRANKIKRPSDFDMIAFMGVKNRDVLLAAHEAGVPYVYFDKGYNRVKGWWRVSFCAHNPTDYLLRLDRPDDRRHKQRWNPKDWCGVDGGHIVIAGSSAKYHELYGLPDPETYWEGIVTELRKHTDRKIIYRPKKSYGNAKPIEGTYFSGVDLIEEEMLGAYAVITHGSNACFEALIEGVPAIVLGNGITRSISSGHADEINHLVMADWDTRIQLLNDLAYFQWKTNEIEEPQFWRLLDDCAELRRNIRATS